MRKFLGFVLLMALGVFAVLGAQAAEDVAFAGQILQENSHWKYDSASQTLVAAAQEEAQVSYQNGVLTLRDLTLKTSQGPHELMSILNFEGALTVELIGSSRIERTEYAPVIAGDDLIFAGTGSLAVKASGFSAVTTSSLTISSGSVYTEMTGMPPYGPPTAVISTSKMLALEGGALYVTSHAPNAAALECFGGAKLTGGRLSIVSDNARGVGITAGNAGGNDPHEESIFLGPDARVEVRAGQKAIQMGQLVELATGRTWHLDRNAKVFVYPTPAVPASGDSAQPILWMLMCALALTGAVLLRRKAAA